MTAEKYDKHDDQEIRAWLQWALVASIVAALAVASIVAAILIADNLNPPPPVTVDIRFPAPTPTTRPPLTVGANT